VRTRPGGLPSLVAAAALLSAVPAAARAQVPEGEVRREAVVALDPARGIGVLEARLRGELGLFGEVEGFVSATLLRPLEGGGWVLELTTRLGGETVRERRPLDAAGLAELRSRIAAAFEARGLTGAVEREGRGGLVLSSTLLGLGYYGWAVPDALGIDSERGTLAGYLLTSGASFLVPYLATRSRAVSRAAASGATWGGTRGIALGTILGDLLALEAEDDNRRRARNGVGVLGSVLTGLAGFAYAGHADHDRGRVALAGALGDFALAGAFTTAYALGLYKGEIECEGDVCGGPSSEARRGGHAVGLALGMAGVGIAARHARDARIGRGDVRVLQSSGVLGVQLVAPLAWAALHDGGDAEERAFAGILVAGAAGGLLVGHRYGVGRALTPSDGLLVLAGHLAGGAAALGITHLLDDDDRDATVYLSTSGVGSLAGALFTYRAVSGGAQRDGPGAAPGARAGRAGVEFHPLGLLAGVAQRARGGRESSGTLRIPPLLTIRF
jgi:hypothetical protein